MSTPTNDGGSKPSFIPSDRLIAQPHEQNVNVWYLVTEDGIIIGVIDCIVGEAFAKGVVNAWNESLAARNQTTK